MTLTLPISIIWEITCLALLWGVFTRSVLTGPDTKRSVRLALLLCGAASLLGLIAPLYGYEPGLIACMVLGANAIFQLVVGQYWADFIAHRALLESGRTYQAPSNLAT